MTELIQMLLLQVGLIIGVAIRTFYPYIKKQSEGEVTAFERRYLYLMLVALITLELGLGVLFMSFGTGFVDTMPPMVALFAGIFTGIGNNEMINRIFPKPPMPVEPEPPAPETHYNIPAVTVNGDSWIEPTYTFSEATTTFPTVTVNGDSKNEAV